MEPRNWTCPYCDRAQTLTEKRVSNVYRHFELAKHKLGAVGLSAQAIACANPYCQEVTVTAYLTQDVLHAVNQAYIAKDVLDTYRLRPQSSSKPQPNYIPAPLREDYQEACAIRDLSPKASATLSRRCLQGMIRDFCGISKKRLIDEIDALRDAHDKGAAPKGVDVESIEAIDHVRTIGNIGAHMEGDINQIIDVDPGEAQALIELIELLFDEWYIARHKRQEKLANIKAIADGKQAEKAAFKVAGGKHP